MPESQNTNTFEFSLAQSKALAGFASGLTLTEIAAIAGVSRQTIYNWREDPNFHRAATACTKEYVDTLRDQLLTLSRKALARIEAILDDPNASHTIALKAALAILNRPQFPAPGWNLPVKNIEVPVEPPAPGPQETVGQNLTPPTPVQPNPSPGPKPPSSEKKTGHNLTPFTPLDTLDDLFLRSLTAARTNYFARNNAAK
jgi:transcriptional regulator with XRE-family HTH domain